MKLAIVMPVLDEAGVLPKALTRLQALRAHGAEVIVADGGSQDASAALAQPLADAVLAAPRGRARQMNAGAAAAASHGPGDALLFLHADTLLPEAAYELVAEALRHHAWGRFDVHIEGRSPALRLVAALMNRRSRWSGIATGDQAVFVRRDAFDAVGGFPDQPLMEDIELSSRLKRRFGRPACLRATVQTSGRRWERRGVWRTIALMWRLRLAYWLGEKPERLAEAYR
ncbi:MAG: TIGR04283 family arsenosugar biosynthesis glycosyltransferase [Methylibium sp.]|uniref:TIGR04283 family arsenosugar biosynthesis glycosyltransferase n=1 Tax=Methylibium sp. TaxID=2067992 RepID=UPI00182DF26B|nr:TIGR04283 family arsenosugar biosynthesis glycosyltransferase [Methylibium sp.]MBA3589004.1 TIGR04283 family arsenosugar biosynthesis glycosyltransferase [Methylibium sp.]MBA3624752.1 TIGR04283 family arsenosugar biosynthesis glycosyltransferase [Methylibium sp.]